MVTNVPWPDSPHHTHHATPHHTFMHATANSVQGRACAVVRLTCRSDSTYNAVMGLEEGGPTALGPALLAAITMAGAGKAGSKVVVCTDGMANVGLGSLEELKTDEDHAIADRFYGESCGDLAKSNGVEVSVITIKGENCRLEYLSKIAESSGGDVTIVDPSNLTQEFANILETPVIATHVQAKILLHSIMEFRNEKLIHLSSNRSTMVREIGNVTEQTEITFEYTLKKAE